MFDYDKYAPYVFWSYGIAAFVLTGVIVWTVLRVRAAQRALNDAENESAEKGREG